MDKIKLIKLIRNYYGYKIESLTYNSKMEEVEFFIYQAFIVRCGIEENRNIFGAGILFGCGEKSVAGEALGKKLIADATETNITKILQTIDEYCRLRLPDKFLEAYDNAYKNKNEHQN